MVGVDITDRRINGFENTKLVNFFTEGVGYSQTKGIFVSFVPVFSRKCHITKEE